MPEQQPAEWNEVAFNKLAEQAPPEPPQQETKPAPEPAAEAPAEPVKEQIKEERVVPLGALHEERAKRRAEAEARRGLEQRVAEMQAQLAAALAPRPQAAPDPATDPAGAILHAQRQTQEQLQAIQIRRQQEEAWHAQQAQVQNVVTRAQTDNAEFVKQQPDANEAIGFLKTQRVNQYQAMGLSRQQALHQMQNDEWQLVNLAYQNGDNPAKVAYDMAVAAGYASPKQKMEMKREGQQTAAPGSQGGQSGGLPSYDTLLKMDSKSFAEATKGDKWKKLMSR